MSPDDIAKWNQTYGPLVFPWRIAANSRWGHRVDIVQDREYGPGSALVVAGDIDPEVAAEIVMLHNAHLGAR